MKKRVACGIFLSVFLFLTTFVTTIRAFNDSVPAQKREQILGLALDYKYGELPENFDPATDGVLLAIQELSLAESKYMLEFIYVFNRAGYPEEVTLTEALIPYAKQRELAHLAAEWAILSQTEAVQLSELMSDDLTEMERGYLQVAFEGVNLILQGRGEEYLSPQEILTRDTIMFLLSKYDAKLFTTFSDEDALEKDADAFMRANRSANVTSGYCGYQFIEGPGAQIDYSLSGGLSGVSSWPGDNDRYQTLCDHVVQYPVISQNLRVDHDNSYDGWCILNSSGGDGAWLARQRVYNGENVLYGGWKAQWCAVTGNGIAQHTRGG